MTDSSLSSSRSLSIRERNPKIHTKYSHPPPCWADQRPSNGGHSTECQVKFTVGSMTQHQAWVRCLVPEKAMSGRTLAPVPRCPGAALPDTRLGHGWADVTRVLMTSWWPWHGCHDVTMSWSPQHFNSQTVPPQSQQSHTCVTLVTALFVCLYLHLSGRCLDLFDCLCFLEILFGQSNNNNVDPSLPRNSPTYQIGAILVTWLSRGSRDTWHLCHESVAPVVTSGPLSQLERDHQSSHLRDRGARILVLFWPKQDYFQMLSASLYLQRVESLE